MVMDYRDKKIKIIKLKPDRVIENWGTIPIKIDT